MTVPGNTKDGLFQRMPLEIPLRPPHELMEEEIEADSSLMLKLQEPIADGKQPPAYRNHPVVAGSTTPVLPYALYMDGVSYSLVDSVIGMWLVSLVSGARHLIGLIRKQKTCKCGCRGWCTFWPLLSFLRWSFDAMARGARPTKRHDGQPFGPADDHRHRTGGQALRCKGALVYLKGDWMEFCERHGFPSHASSLRPCFCCNTDGGPSSSNPAGWSLLGSPCRINREEDFEAAVQACEIHVTLCNTTHQKIKNLLVWDRRAAGSRGRSLAGPVEEAGLLKGDRLEPSPSLPDVGDFEGIQSFPAQVTFWRPSRSTLLHHRSPLWDRSLGICPVRSIAIDLLHTFT